MNKDILFSINDIKKLATNTSFERGEIYYKSNAVKNIRQNNNHFEAKVAGTEMYHVTLDIEHDELDFDCNCPYDLEGICKHCVALGLAVIGKKPVTQECEANLSPHILRETFNQCFDSADNQKKLNFLKQLLEKDTDLQSQFIAFVESQSGKLDDIAGIDIDKIAGEVHQDLSDIDFDDVLENSHGYSYDYDEDSFDEAYSLIENALERYYKIAVDFLKKGNLLDAFRMMLGIYEGVQNLPEPLDNDYLFDNGYDLKVMEYVGQFIAKFAKEIEQVIISDEIIKQVIDLLIDRYQYWKNVESQERRIEYDIADFDSVCISFLTNATIADYLWVKIQANNLVLHDFAFVILEIATRTSNEKLWYETAEAFAADKSLITAELLKRYKSNGRIDDFNRIAHLSFTNWANQFDSYLVENLDKNDEQVLYVKALTNLVNRVHKIEYYSELRAYFNSEQKNRFIHELSQSHNYNFYINVLELEERYEEILHCAKNGSSDYYLTTTVKPILNIYPDDCYTLLKNKCNGLFNTYNRNRKTYQIMVGLMVLMKQITSKQTDANQYFQDLYNNRMPALKDEMQRAGLV